MLESKSGRECASIFHSAMFECLEETFIGQKRTVCKLHASCDVILWPRLRKRNKSTSWKQNRSKTFYVSIFEIFLCNQFLSKYQLIQKWILCNSYVYNIKSNGKRIYIYNSVLYWSLKFYLITSEYTHLIKVICFYSRI